jgi:muconolactone D-isomerase
MPEFLVEIEIALPPSTPADEQAALAGAERLRGQELLDAGSIVQIWRVPGRRANVGIWQAADASELHRLISSLPLFPWMDVRVSALAEHPLARDDRLPGGPR